MADNPEVRRYKAFGGSSKDITLRTPLWRYMTFEKFCWFVEKAELYHTRLDRFDDPFEGAVTDAYARMRDAGQIEPYYTTKEWEPWVFKSLRFREFATCWHASEYESDALWKLYAPGGAGIAVVSTMLRITQFVELAPDVHGMLGQIEYVNFADHDMRRGPTVIRPGHLKRKSFEYEREVRGIILTNLIIDGSHFTANDAVLEQQRLRQPLGINAKVDLKGLIQSIIVSPSAESFVGELVQIITKRHGLDHLVRASELLKLPAY